MSESKTQLENHCKNGSDTSLFWTALGFMSNHPSNHPSEKIEIEHDDDDDDDDDGDVRDEK